MQILFFLSLAILIQYVVFKGITQIKIRHTLVPVIYHLVGVHDLNLCGLKEQVITLSKITYSMPDRILSFVGGEWDNSIYKMIVTTNSGGWLEIQIQVEELQSCLGSKV